MPISRIGTDGIDQTSSQQIGGISVGRGGGAVSTNTAVGASALAANTTGSSNVAMGYQAAFSNTTGTSIDAFGTGALYSNTTGTNNSGFGAGALVSNTTGGFNAAFGRDALRSNTTATQNTAVGYQAGYSNTTGANLVALGYQAGYSSNADNNTFIGYYAGQGTTGTRNTFVGVNGVGYLVSSGTKNTIIGGYNGNQGGLDIRTASNYIVLSDGDGTPALYVLAKDGSNNADIHLNNNGGTFSQLSFDILSVRKAAIWWDNSLSRLQTYTNTSGPYIANGGTSWTNSSDERLKNITGEIQNGLAKVCTLRAAEYTWKYDESATPKVGLIAQDVLAVLPEAVTVPEEGATEKDGLPAMMGVQYTEVIPLLVAAIKELKAEFDAYKEAHP